MGRMKEVWFENVRKGFETFVKEEIKGVISLNVMIGKYDKDNWMFQDHELFEDIVDGLYLECLPQIEETVREVVEGNFEVLKKVS